MATVAEQLKKGREQRKLTVEQVADFTKIKGDHIHALEMGRYDVFVAPVYIRGFVRSYANMLKLDVAEVLRQLDVELGGTERFRAHPALDPQSKGWTDAVTLLLSRVNWMVVLPIVVALAILGGAVFGYRKYKEYKTRDPLQSLGEGLYKSDRKSGGELLPLQP